MLRPLRPWGPITVSLGAMLLMACGGGRPAWVERQRALLDEDDVVGGAPAAPAQAAAAAMGAPVAARPITARDATQSRCVGFTPDGRAALVVREERQTDAKGQRITLTADVVAAGQEARLSPVALASFDPSESEDALLGDGLEALVGGQVPAVNAQIESAGLLGCQKAKDSDSGAGFQRKTRHLMAFPKGHATRIMVRDGGLFVAPEGRPARKVRPIAEGSGLELADAWFLSTQPHVVVMLTVGDRDRVHSELVFVGDVAP